MNTKQQFLELAKPFEFEEIEVKPQSISKSKDKALCVPYIRASAARARLNAIFEPWNWHVEYREVLAGKGGVVCRLTVTTAEGQTVVREGMAGFSDIEAIKGGESDSFKRAFAALGNDTLQYAELGWHPIKVYGEGERAKFDGWCDLAAIRRKYETLMELGKKAQPATSAAEGENPASSAPGIPAIEHKVKAFRLSQVHASALKKALQMSAVEFQQWLAARYDDGDRTFDDLKKRLD